MRIYSFIQKDGELVPVEVELSLSPGLPQLTCLGMPDQHIRESAQRVRSALKQQGFEFPKGRQVLVNLRPSYGKKTSRGLDFAIAAALLWETGQLQRPEDIDSISIYGELSLRGEVFEPEDLGECPVLSGIPLWTGRAKRPAPLAKERFVFQELKALEGQGQRLGPSEDCLPERPSAGLSLMVSSEQAKLLSIVALGEHSSLMLGPSGTGKSTLASALVSLLETPAQSTFWKLKQTAQKFGEEISWRPIVKPHHTTPIKSMVGGGQVPGAGEISRAHGGILLLDEFFEFQPRVLEALREPFEEGAIRVARGGRVKVFPARVLILGTANLCPCGDWAPGRVAVQCSYSLRKCQSYIERMSGPLLDRFQVMAFSHQWGKSGEVTIQSVLEEIEAARSWRKKRRPDQTKPNSLLSAEECIQGLDEFSKQNLLPKFSSRRRELAALRVARTLADLEKSESLRIQHIDQALHWAVTPWQQLKAWM